MSALEANRGHSSGNIVFLPMDRLHLVYNFEDGRESPLWTFGVGVRNPATISRYSYTQRSPATGWIWFGFGGWPSRMHV